LEENILSRKIQVKCHWLQVLKVLGREKANKKVNNKKVDSIVHGRFPWIFP